MTKAETALEALIVSDKLMLTPSDVAPVLGCEPYAINVQAQEDPTRLGFPVVVIRRRVRIPRLPFLSWLIGNQHITTHDGGGDITCG